MALTKVTGQVINTNTDVTVGVLTVTNTLAVGGTVSIGGTLTYEDVTNIDSVGLITARNGIVVGSGITLSKDGDGFFTGVVTATSYRGDGSSLTGISVDSTQIVTGNTSVQTVDTGSDGHVKVNTEGSERVRIIADGKVGVNKTAPNFHLDVAGNVGLTEGQVITWHDGSGTKAGDMYIDSSDNFIIRNTSSVSERLRIASDGHVKFGSGDPVGAATVEVNHTDATLMLRDTTDTSSAGDCKLAFGNDSAYPTAYISHSWNETSGTLNFYTRVSGNEHERMRIHGGGTVSIPNGIELGSGVDGTTANTLDDYEEGTWTPTMGAIASPNYSVQVGRYTKIGNLVNAQAYLLMASGGGEGSAISIGSLPFTSSNTNYHEGGGYIIYENGFFSATAGSAQATCTVWVPANNTIIQFHKRSNGAAIYGNDTAFGLGANNKYLIVQVQYTVA